MTPFQKDVEKALALLSEDTEQGILFLLARLLDQRKDLELGKSRELRERGIHARDQLRRDPRIAEWKVRADFDARHVLNAEDQPPDFPLGAIRAEIKYNNDLLAYAMEKFKKETTP